MGRKRRLKGSMLDFEQAQIDISDCGFVHVIFVKVICRLYSKFAANFAKIQGRK